MKPKTKILQGLRISESSQSQITAALAKLNSKSPVTLTLADYRRIAYLYLARDVMNDNPLDELDLWGIRQ